MSPRLRTCCLVVLLVVAAGAAPLAAATSTTAATPAAADASTDETIELTQELRLTPNRPGEYDAHHRYRIPAGVVQLTVRLPDGARATDTSGFDHDGGDTYAWDGSTRRPTLTYRVPANRTVDRDDPIAGPGRYMFVDAGPWALVMRPQVAHEWGWTGGGQVSLSTRLAVDGEGAAGEAVAFLGPHEVHTRTAHGQTFRLVVPETATLEADPTAILDSLAHASDSLRVGSRDDEVFLVAAPTNDVEWGVRGLRTGRADVWVRDAEPLAVADNVWLHEYVHTRQGYAAADDLRWFTEGTAVYYAALLSLEQERIDFDAFRDRLDRGGGNEFDDVHLADPGTWHGDPEYHVGALVAGELDRQLRLGSASERSLQDTFRRMNDESGSVDADRFEGLLRADGGDEVAALAARYTRTTDRPALWDETSHADAFGLPLPRIATTVQPDYRVHGPYRSGALADPLDVVPGETLSFDVRVDNVGDRSGDYDVRFRVDGTERAARTGRLDPGESVDLAFDHRFEAVGDHLVSVGDATVPVRVSPPARATVTGFSVDRATVDPGDVVTLTVVVENTADRPARLEFPVTHDGSVFAREDVRLGPAETSDVTVRRTLEAPGEHRFGLGEVADEEVVVTVAAEPIERDQSGFGALAALLALLLVAIGASRRG